MASHHNAGKGMLKFLIFIILVAGLAYIGWVTYAKYQRTGEIDAGAVFNSDDRRAAHDDAQPHLNTAVEFGKGAIEKLSELSEEAFGEGGYIDQASAWLDSQKGSPIEQVIAEEEGQQAPENSQSPVNQTPTSQPKPPAKPAKSAETKRLENIILDAESDFTAGMGYYQAANPANGGWTAERKRAVKQAHEAFKSVRSKLSSGGNADLYDLVEKYGRQSDHNPAVLRSAREMKSYNQKLIGTAGKMASAF